jgi:hypothetical protein
MSVVLPVRHLVNGFMSGPLVYQAFFERNFGWLVAVLFYVTVIFSAMQVGLARESLQANAGFQRASVGFATSSIIVVMITVGTMLLMWVVLFWYHLLSTWQYCKYVNRKRAKAIKELI